MSPPGNRVVGRSQCRSDLGSAQRRSLLSIHSVPSRCMFRARCSRPGNDASSSRGPLQAAEGRCADHPTRVATPSHVAEVRAGCLGGLPIRESAHPDRRSSWRQRQRSGVIPEHWPRRASPCQSRIPGVTATARWSEEHAVRTAASADIAQLWAEIEASAVAPVILVLEAGGAEAHAVVGDTTGTALLYYPGGYEKAGAGSLHSVGDRARAERDDWESPLTAYYFGHHTEFPRWSVVPSVDGRRALAEFCERPNVPPTAILWEPD